jgi:tRNA A37 methylthiotransferase MiaB
MTIDREKIIAKETTTKENRIWVRISAACNNKCVFCLDSEAQDGRLIPEDTVKTQILA